MTYSNSDTFCKLSQYMEDDEPPDFNLKQSEINKLLLDLHKIRQDREKQRFINAKFLHLVKVQHVCSQYDLDNLTNFIQILNSNDCDVKLLHQFQMQLPFLFKLFEQFQKVIFRDYLVFKQCQGRAKRIFKIHRIRKMSQHIDTKRLQKIINFIKRKTNSKRSVTLYASKYPKL